MFNFVSVRSRSIAWVLPILVGVTTCLAVQKGATAERKLTKAEMLTSFGGDGSAECCAFNPACYYANTYTQTCASLTPSGATYCTAITVFVGNTSSCQPTPDCPLSWCVMTGDNTVCARRYNCTWAWDPNTGGFSCSQGLNTNWQLNPPKCMCALDPSC